MLTFQSIIFLIIFILAYQGASHTNFKIRFISIFYIFLSGFFSLMGLIKVLYFMFNFGVGEHLLMSLVINAFSTYVVYFVIKQIFRKDSFIDIIKYIIFRAKHIYKYKNFN